jgi:hypothetical protein
MQRGGGQEGRQRTDNASEIMLTEIRKLCVLLHKCHLFTMQRLHVDNTDSQIVLNVLGVKFNTFKTYVFFIVYSHGVSSRVTIP